MFDGFPVEFKEVKIGNRVWLPFAWVNPGVTIGNDVVVAAFSLVNKDIPSGSLAGGIPAKIIKENVYPRKISEEEKMNIIKIINEVLQKNYILNNDIIKADNGTIFNLAERTIEGKANEETERLKNQLRRLGIRFRYYIQDGWYVKW